MKTALDRSGRAWQSPHVPDTEGNEIGVSEIAGGRIRPFGGFFTSIACAALSMAGLAGEGQPSPVPVFRYANLASACHPIGVGCGIETANTGVHAMRLIASGKPAHTLKPKIQGNSRFSLRIDLYRALRLVAGPVLAHRVAFGFKGVCRG